MRRAPAKTVGWAAVLLAGGCEQPRTELVVRVDSEVAWGPGQRVQSVVLTVRRGGAAGPLRSVRTTALGREPERRPLPLYVGVTAAGDDTETPVWVEALGCTGVGGCTQATAWVAQRAVVSFARGQTLELPLSLTSACVQRACGSDERCATSGVCEPATQAQATARSFAGADAATAWDAVAERPDAGTRDASATDTGIADTGIADTGIADTGIADTGIADTGIADTGIADTGIADTGPATPCPSGMRLVPAGRFQMGDAMSDDATAQPVHGVQVTAFCMDEALVTAASFQACVTSGGCTAPDTTMYCNWGVPGREQHPINCVDWNQARAYCQRRGGDLPTEAQWEYAARGTDGRTYPWGDAAPGPQLCWNRFPIPATTCPVRSYPSGDSPFRLSDMAGNVWQWTLDAYGPYSGNAGTYAVDPVVGGRVDDARVMRGGSWYSSAALNVRAAFRNIAMPTQRVSYVGFRCAHAPL